LPIKRRKMMSEESKMSDEFHDWLEECPVEWRRIQHDETGASYKFFKDDEILEEEDDE